MKFYIGLHQPSDAKRFSLSMVSVNRLRKRRTFKPSEWIMDSGAFTELNLFGRYRHSPEEYAAEIRRWGAHWYGRLVAAVTQDYMCEPFILNKTGLTVLEHQRLTIERYDAIMPRTQGTYLMPVLQGFDPSEYVAHVRLYGPRIASGAWVGVGSVCKRNASPGAVFDVLAGIKAERPDLRLHGFGLKTTALADPRIVAMLHSADSMAWSKAARLQGRDSNDWREAETFRQKIVAAVPASSPKHLNQKGKSRHGPASGRENLCRPQL